MGAVGMNEGFLMWDASSGRIEIKFKDGGYYGGIHCGDTIDIFIHGHWMPTRIEYRHSRCKWYLVGLENDEEIIGMKARI